MRRILFAALTAAWSAFATTTVHADTNVISRVGNWQAFSGTSSVGRPVCGVSADVDGQYFSVKYFAGITTAVVQMGGKSLDLAEDAKQIVQFHIDDHDGWKATGVGMKFNDGDPGIEFKISKEELDEFVEELLSGHSLTVSLLDSNNNDWSFDLTGTRTVHSAIAGCINKLPSDWQEK